MIKSGFYDSINHDRLYGADDFSDYFEGRMHNNEIYT